MKLKEFLEAIHHHTKDIPNADELEVIFATDDEGNEYCKVHFEPALCQLHNSKEDRFLEIVGIYGEKNIDKRDINAIIIN